MILELHDSEEGNSLVADAKGITHISQAEAWIDETFSSSSHTTVILWVLLSDEGEILHTWKRSKGSPERPVKV